VCQRAGWDQTLAFDFDDQGRISTIVRNPENWNRVGIIANSVDAPKSPKPAAGISIGRLQFVSAAPPKACCRT
jgi:hypothetical protein